MKLMTLNLNTYQEEDQMAKFHRIAAEIVREEIDVICFCEAAQSLMSDRVDEYIRADNAVRIICARVNELLGQPAYHFVWDLSHYGFKIFEEGIAIMSRYPVTSVVTQYVSHTHDIFTFKSRKILKAGIQLPAQTVDVYSCQLGWEDDEYEPFAAQFLKLDEWVKSESKDHPVILAGDFSNDALTPCYQMILNAGYRDQYTCAGNEITDETFIYPQGYDLTNEPKRLRLDYIFTYGQPFPVLSARRLFSGPERVSDHMAVLVDWDIAS